MKENKLVAALKAKFAKENITLDEYLKRWSEAMKEVYHDSFARRASELEYISNIDRINSLELSDPEVYKEAEKEMFDCWVRAVTGGKFKDRNLCHCVALALTTRVIGAKNGIYDVQVEFYKSRKQGNEAYVDKENIVHLNMAGSKFERAPLFNSQVFPVSDTIERLAQLQRNQLMSICHEIEHLIQDKNFDKAVPEGKVNPVVEVIGKSEIVRMSKLGNCYYNWEGHNEFVTEMDAEASGLIGSKIFIDKLIDYIEKLRENPKAVTDNPALEKLPNSDIIREKLEIYDVINIEKEKKILLDMALYFGYVLNENLEFVDKGNIHDLNERVIEFSKAFNLISHKPVSKLKKNEIENLLLYLDTKGLRAAYSKTLKPKEAVEFNKILSEHDEPQFYIEKYSKFDDVEHKHNEKS